MHDIKQIRENPQAWDNGLARRGIAPLSGEVKKLDEARRAKIAEVEAMQARRNSIAKEIGKVKGLGGDASALLKEAEDIKQKMAEFEASGDEVSNLLATFPNIPADDVPTGKDENDNVEIRKVGTPRKFDFTPKPHYEIGEGLGLLDFEQTAKISGARFATLKGELARLERKLANFMIDLHTTEFGYTEMRVPHLVKDIALYGTAQLPKFANDLYSVNIGGPREFSEGDDFESGIIPNSLWLIPTAEVPLTNQVNDKILDEKELPLRFTGQTQCFRSEAGSAGKDTRGLIRMHEFSKVELVSITKPEDSEAEHLRMLSAAEEVLKRLELPYRVICLCTGDMGFSSKKTYDIEVWLPSQNTYREISSISNCGDFQARRMKARYKKDGKMEFIHTLNGSGLAIGRTIVAILENYQTADGGFEWPKALK